MTVNGERHERNVAPRTLLVQFLRDHVGLTGTNIGCDTGQCGACTVHMDGMAIKSCLTLALQADGSEIITVEGLAKDGKLHPLQQSFWDNHGLQCGYCTAGMIMSALDLLKSNPHLTEADVRQGLSGNLCRCTGYENIIKSVHAAAAILRGAS